MGKRENKVETYLKDEIKRLGGLCYKWESPGEKGVPDRIVIINGKIYFIEIKTVDGVTSPQQTRQIAKLKLNKANVHVLFGEKQVDEFINNIKELIK